MSKSLFPKLKCPMSIEIFFQEHNYVSCHVLNEFKARKSFKKELESNNLFEYYNTVDH